MNAEKNDVIVNKFVKDIACLDDVYKELSDINLFEILKIDQMEIRHSNFLAWLLDPASPSGIGDKMLKRLLLFCSENDNKSSSEKNRFDAINIELMDLDDVVIKREHSAVKNGNAKKIDLLIFSEKEKFCICIENKINSNEHTDQLTNYHEYIENHFARKDTKYVKYKYDNRYYILLSPTGVDAEKEKDRDSWIALSYADIYDWINEYRDTYSEKIPAKSKILIDDYLKSLNRNVIEGEFKKTCDRIYMNHVDAFEIFKKYKGKDASDMPDISPEFKLYDKHRAAIDLVLDNRIEITEKIKLCLVEALKSNGQCVQYDSKRAPVYLKVPMEVTNDERLVERAYDDISKDFLFFELYYAPGEKCYYVNLRWQLDNCPENFDSEMYRKNLKKKTLIYSKKIFKNQTSEYVAELEKNPREPSKDEEFIQNLCFEVINAINNDKAKKECQEISNAITK